MRTSSKKPFLARVSWADVAAAAAGWALSIATTAALVAVGWFGHATHWTFGFGGHAAAHHHEAAAHADTDADTAPAVDGPAIRFPSREALERTGIELVPVETRPVVSELVVNGVVSYDERRIAQLSTRVAGSIWRVEKHLGNLVRKGEVLLIIDSQAVGQAKAEFLNALVVYESRREQLAILEEVKTAIMGRQLREAVVAVREARNHLTNAEQSLVNLGFEIAVSDFESLNDEARAARIRTLGLPAGLLESLGAERVSSNLLPLYAPFDGIVVGREAVVGEVVEAARPIFEVADVSTMLLELAVAKEDASKVAIGQPVRFRPDGSAAEITSRVSWISTEVDETTRTLRVRAEVVNRQSDGPDGERAGLRANTYGSGRIEIGRRATAVVVPRNSVQWDGSRWVVFVPAGEMAFEPRAVEPGVPDGDRLEIAGPAAADPALTHVVGSGSHVLKSQILLERMGAGKL